MSALKLAMPVSGAPQRSADEFDRLAHTIMARARVGHILCLGREQIETLLDLALGADEAERAT